MSALNPKRKSSSTPARPMAISANGNLQLAKDSKQIFFETIVSAFYGRDDMNTFHANNMKNVQSTLKALVDAKMDVGIEKILTESKVSIATLKQYKRFNLDELSYRNDDPLPPEIKMN